MSENVYVIGTGLTKFGKFLDKSVKQLSGKALDLVLKGLWPRAQGYPSGLVFKFDLGLYVIPKLHSRTGCAICQWT